MNQNTLPRWAHWTPDTGTTEMLGVPRPPVPGSVAAKTEPMHLLDLKPFVQPLRQSWNSMLTVAGVIGVAAALWLVKLVVWDLGQELGWFLLALSGSDVL